MSLLPNGVDEHKPLLVQSNCVVCGLAPGSGLSFCPHCHHELPCADLLRGAPASGVTRLLRLGDGLICGVCHIGIWCCVPEDGAVYPTLPTEVVVTEAKDRVVCGTCGKRIDHRHR